MTAAKVVIFVAVIVAALGSEKEAPTDQSSENRIADPSACASEFLEWCRNRSESSGYFQGIALSSEDGFQNEQRIRIHCISNSTGINCAKNDSPWYRCFRNGSLEYKGKELKPGFEDDEICNTKDRARRMFGPHNVTFNHTEFENSMKLFRERMRQFDQQMRDLGRRLQAPMPNIFRRHEEP